MQIVFLLFLLVAAINTSAQFYIGAGAQVQLAGNAQLALKDINFINNGSFSAGNSTVYFSGGTDALISGTEPIQFYTIQINKDGQHQLTLQRAIGVSHELQFTNGLIDLNGHNIDLGSTGLLNGESETSRIVGPVGGEVLFATALNAPAGADPGNLGAMISSSQNLGNAVIRRGHQPQTLTDGSSILRYYNITPSNNSGLDATLRFSYFDAELNNLSENALVQWRSEDGVTWSEKGFTTRDVTTNYVEKTGIEAFSTWTLSSPSSPLPVLFLGFNLQCHGDMILLQWKTAQEINSSHFVVERNSGSGWRGIATLAAAGNSSIEKSYTFTDNYPSGKANYRIAQYDLDGQVAYTSTARADCGVATDALQAWPNPFSQSFTIRIDALQQSAARIRVTDTRGAVIINRQLDLQRGVNQFELDLQKAAAGVYLVTVEWAEGRQIKTMRLIKQ